MAARVPGNAARQLPADMDGHQLAQWLTVQEGDTAGTLQHGARP